MLWGGAEILCTPGAEQYASSLLLRKEMHGGGYPEGLEESSLQNTHLLPAYSPPPRTPEESPVQFP